MILKLYPDEALYAEDQLCVEPTAPENVCVAAGKATETFDILSVEVKVNVCVLAVTVSLMTRVPLSDDRPVLESKEGIWKSPER